MVFTDPTGNYTVSAIWNYLFRLHNNDTRLTAEAYYKLQHEQPEYFEALRRAESGDVMAIAYGPGHADTADYYFTGQGDSQLEGITPVHGNHGGDISLADIIDQPLVDPSYSVETYACAVPGPQGGCLQRQVNTIADPTPQYLLVALISFNGDQLPTVYVNPEFRIWSGLLVNNKDVAWRVNLTSAITFGAIGLSAGLVTESAVVGGLISVGGSAGSYLVTADLFDLEYGDLHIVVGPYYVNLQKDVLLDTWGVE